MTAANPAEIGKVMNQVINMFLAVPHFTPLIRWAEPTPRMDEEMTWVVLTGMCKKVAPKMIPAPVMSAATPLIGRIFMIFPPTVLMIFHPPIEVPSAMATAQESCTQNGTSEFWAYPLAIRAIVIIPIDF